MSSIHPQIDGTTISIRDDDDIGAEEPQMPRAPSAHQEQSLSFEPRPTDMGWDVLQDGGAMTGAQVYGTPAYNTQGGPHMGQYPDISTNAGHYAVQHAYPPPATLYPNVQPQTPFEMDAGTDAGQASYHQMHCQPDMSPSALQVHHNLFSPSQSPMTATGFEPNSMGQLDGTGPPSRPNPASFANASPSYQDPGEPNGNPNAWTQGMEDLVRRHKHEGKKSKQTAYELKERFGVVKSCNSISKRWKIIKNRYSKVESKKVIQNVMTSSLQLLNTELARIVPGIGINANASAQDHHQNLNRHGQHHDPQVSGSIHEAEECFQKGYTKLVEEYMFVLQRGHAQGQGRHGGANL